MTNYQIDQLVISSLIGHSTVILDQPCPTLVVFHDYFPYWPRLDIAIDELSSEETAEKLVSQSEERLEAHHHLKLANRTAAQWIELRQSLIRKLERPNITCVAPDQSVIDNLIRIDASFSDTGIEIIPHGSRPLSRLKPIGLSADPGQRKLRVLIPGRLSDVKGKHLLQPLVRDCADVADFYLLGAGKDAEDFFGRVFRAYHHGLSA